jgi:hypothetical protein
MPDELPRVDDLDLTGWVVRESILDRSRFVGVVMRGAEIDGLVEDLVVNGVEVSAYVEAELDRREPVRVLMRSDDPDDLREAWAQLQATWADTIARLHGMGEEAAQTGVDGEWSAVQTLRHLVFVTDSWLAAEGLGRTEPFHPLGQGASFMDGPTLGLDHDARPSLDEVLAVRAERVALVQRILHEATPQSLVAPAAGSVHGFPGPAEGRTLLDCVHVVLNEEWAHHSFCARDLDRLERAGAS